ncbi:MAG: hypothetical protein Q4E53_02245 [Eubacteriales bacterium]|nr:hypothetical protein [Eubacteriales bacterium]
MEYREEIKDEMLEEVNGGVRQVSAPRCDTIDTTFVEEQNKNIFGSFFHSFMNLFKKETPSNRCDVKMDGNGVLFDDINKRG